MIMFRSLDLRGKQKEVAAVYDQHGRAELKQEETRVVFSVSSTRTNAISAIETPYFLQK